MSSVENSLEISKLCVFLYDSMTVQKMYKNIFIRILYELH